MTGGQPAEGGLTVSQIAHQVSAEGAKRLVIVSDDPDKYPANYFPSGATIHHRRELDAVQKLLREVKGLSVLIYDQTCAAEKRRRRKRGLYPDPPKRVFINERVCEGCGDCSQASNCVSVQPLETEFGRKRRIDQSNCNKDFSCIEGFCPSFVTVHGGKLRKADRAAADPSALFADLPTPATPALDGAYNILVTGIGGTGVITIGALLGMAAHVEGKACSTLDFTGLSQKNGAVMSHVRIAPSADDLANVRIGPGSANLILGCDIVVATSVTALSRAERGVTRAVVNADLLPTASFVIDPDIDFQAGTMRDALNEAVSAADLDILDANGLATALMGDSIATNSFMLGFAFQRGAIPLSLEAIMKAIDLNGAAIDMNKLAFSWGRLAAHDLQRVISAARFKNSGAQPAKRTLDESIAFRAKLPDRLPGRGLFEALPFRSRARPRRRGEVFARIARTDRSLRKRPVQADGLQGRVRGRPALFRRRICQGAAGAVRRQPGRQGQPRAAAAGGARPRRPDGCRSASSAAGSSAPSTSWPGSSPCAARRSIRSAIPPNAGWSGPCRANIPR